MDNVLPNDPLFSQQWYLNNTGQSGGTPGADINVLPAWEIATGNGVTIGIVDGAVDVDHPDLEAQHSPVGDYDYSDDISLNSFDFDFDASSILNSDDREFPFDEPSDLHGTPVAGIAVASNNEVGITGVAYDASFTGLRIQLDEHILFPDLDAQIASALSDTSFFIDIYNNSWRIPVPLVPFEKATQALETGINEDRRRLGKIFVFAAGNNAQEGGNVNYYPLTNSRYTITVGALDHNGVRSYYSNPGASLLISTYANGDDEGILTTDVQGDNGLDPSEYAEFDGTSAATPIVSGVIALMLEANPDLTWRDVQHILVETAVQNDPNNLDWTENGAGYLVNHNYGFGSVNAAAAVTRSQDWQTVEPETSVSSEVININANVPDNNPNGITSTINIEEDLKIESIEIVTDADLVQEDLEVILTSPDGTRSILSSPNSLNSNQDSLNSNQEGTWTFTSLRHWGESSAGEWTLSVIDSEESSSETSWDSWQLNFYGTTNNASTTDSDSSNVNTTDSDSSTSENSEFQSGGFQSLRDSFGEISAEISNINNIIDNIESGLNSDNSVLFRDNYIVIPNFETNSFFANTVAPDTTIIEIDNEEDLDSVTPPEGENVAIQIDGNLYVAANTEGRDTVSTDIDDLGLTSFFNLPPDTSLMPISIEEQGEEVYLLFNNERNLQFFTTSEIERDNVLQNSPQYESQGISFIAAPEPEGNDITGISPVYRLFNSDTGVHLYTISEAEKNSVENLPNYTLEGVEYYGYETEIGGTTPLYRFYNQRLGAHFYTPSSEERDEYIADPDFQIEGNGGVAFYVQPAPDI
ncbi:MAG: S8 family serine peptidase [Pleurocapsa sp. MO_226.B13]|nr:S8 family serine peptidase [Pleurocapsa sp. MO_226.B13]